MKPRLLTLVLFVPWATLAGAGNLAAPSGLPPMPPLAPSPVAAFRELLAMGPEQRQAALEKRPERQRATLLERLAEYQSLPSTVREERLRATDLYWHLDQLFRRTPAERGGLLRAAPAELREILAQRLAVWDRLSAEDQRALLQHEPAIRYFARLREMPPPPIPTLTNAGLPLAPARPAVSARLQEDLARLRTLSPRERERIQHHWKQLFDSPEGRPESVLSRVDARERQELAEVVQRLNRLSAAERKARIEAVTRLANMSPSERAAFLQHAERWGTLTPAEREAWRRLMDKVPTLPDLPGASRGPAALPAQASTQGVSLESAAGER